MIEANPILLSQDEQKQVQSANAKPQAKDKAVPKPKAVGKGESKYAILDQIEARLIGNQWIDGHKQPTALDR